MCFDRTLFPLDLKSKTNQGILHKESGIMDDPGCYAKLNRYLAKHIHTYDII